MLLNNCTFYHYKSTTYFLNYEKCKVLIIRCSCKNRWSFLPLDYLINQQISDILYTFATGNHHGWVPDYQTTILNINENN